MKSLLRYILKILARATIQKYQPTVIGVTGSVGKTSTKEAIAATLGAIRRVRASYGNFNTEIGLPLTILGEWRSAGGPFFYLRVIFSSLARLVVRAPYPELLVLEYAADRPGDIRYLLSIARPHIAVITAVGAVPVHVEFYPDIEGVAREKARLAEALPAAGFAILNSDDELVSALREKTRGHVTTFGFSPDAELRIANLEYRKERGRPVGISFKLVHGETFVPVRIPGTIGRPQAYAAAAAAAVGLIFGMHLGKIADALLYYQPPPHRGRLLPGGKGAIIIDDSYNASPLSMQEALVSLRELRGGRKIAVLGDMRELGKYSIPSHEALGKLAASALDALVTVGDHAKFIAETAHKAGLARRNIKSFATAEEARDEVLNLVRPGDIVLVKGSRAVKLEIIIEALKET